MIATVRTAEPCIDCGTTGGACHKRRQPIRWNGRCSRCYYTDRRTPDDGYRPSPLEIAAKCQMIRRAHYRTPQGREVRLPRAH